MLQKNFIFHGEKHSRQTSGTSNNIYSQWCPISKTLSPLGIVHSTENILLCSNESFSDSKNWCKQEKLHLLTLSYLKENPKSF